MRMPKLASRLVKRRGFAILIILAVIATTSVVLATQLASVEHQQMSALRAAEELKARDVAEGCLSAADAYLQNVAAADTNVDFDLLLDPDDNLATTGDNLLPPTDLLPNVVGIANVPPGVNDQFHHYRVFNVGGVGACFIRFDDNSDDSNPLGALARFTDAGEGTGVDLPQRDRDRAMAITVIGVVPYRTTLADLYPRAHAVATVSVQRALPPSVASGAAIEAGGTFYGDGAVCGQAAGVIADAIQGGCVCGGVDAQLISGSLASASAGGDCGCPECAPNSSVSIGPGARPNPTVTVPPFADLLANVAFGAPGSSANNIAAGTYGIAAVLIRDAESINPATGTAYSAAPAYQSANSADVFAWDIYDDDALATLGGGAIVTLGTGATDCRDTSTMDPLPRPCRWGPTGNVTPTQVVCSGTESPCWKLVARLGTGNGPIADLDVRGAVARGEHSSSTNPDSSFAPRNTALPNFKNATTWTSLSPGACSTCGGTAVVTMAGNDYTVTSSFDRRSAPHLVLAVETTASATVATGGLPSANHARLSILAQSRVAPGAGTNQCCATCDPGCAFGTCSAGPPPTAGSTQDKGLGFAVRTSGPCAQVVNNITMFGTLQCSTIEADLNNHCYVGGFIQNASPGNLACTLPGTPNTAFCNAAAGVCMKNNLDLVGDVIAAGNICIKNNFDGTGTIQTQGSVGWKNNGGYVGQIRAQGDVVMKNNNQITFDGVGGSSDAQGIASSFWLDSSW